MGFKHIGKVKDAQGLKGDIFVIIFSKESTWKSELNKFQLRNPKDNQTITFEIDSIRDKKDGIVVKAIGIDTRNQSESLIGYDFLIDEELLISKKGDVIYLNEILNFKAVDMQQIVIGEVTGFSSNGAQDLLLITNNESDEEYEVPFVEAFVNKIDYQCNTLVLDLPPGLLEVNKK